MVCSQRTKQDNYHSSFYLLYTLAIYVINYCVTHYCVITNSVLTTVHAPEEAIKRYFFSGAKSDNSTVLGGPSVGVHSCCWGCTSVKSVCSIAPLVVKCIDVHAIIAFLHRSTADCRENERVCNKERRDQGSWANTTPGNTHQGDMGSRGAEYAESRPHSFLQVCLIVHAGPVLHARGQQEW